MPKTSPKSAHGYPRSPPQRPWGRRDRRKFHGVKGPDAKREFRELLEVCNAQAAIPYFDQWRFYRQAVNVGVASGASLTLIGALAATSPVGIVALSVGVPELILHLPASAAFAGQAKADMLHAIMESRRARK